MTKTERTKGPWKAQPVDSSEGGVAIIGLRTNEGIPYDNPTNGMVAWATMHSTEMDNGDTQRAEANAAFIVEACNSYDALIAALDYIQMHSNEKAIREKAASALSQTGAGA